MTVVLDTNVLIAAMVAEGLCREVVHRALRRRLVVSSSGLMDELDATLEKKFKMTPAAAAFLTGLRQHIKLIEPVALPTPVCRDPDDDLVLATAVTAEADLIVTGDDDLLVLEAFKGVSVVSSRRFLERLDAAR